MPELTSTYFCTEWSAGIGNVGSACFSPTQWEKRTVAYLKEAKAIWTQFVPKSGQAGTVQGELLRAVEKLRDGAIRNGNGNWDQGFEMLLAYLRNHLLDAAVFPSDVIRQTEVILARLRNHDDPLMEDAPYDDLGDRVVEYYRHYGSKPHTVNPHLRR